MRKKKERTPKWTVEDITGQEFLALCARQNRGELHISTIARGKDNGFYHLLYEELKPHTADKMHKKGETICNRDAKTSHDEQTVLTCCSSVAVDFSNMKAWK